MNHCVCVQASVVIPGFTINRVVRNSRVPRHRTIPFSHSHCTGKQVAASTFAAQRMIPNSPVLRRWAPTAIGLSVIPLIIHPIDHLVDTAMDSTTRKWTAQLLERFDKK